MNQRPSFMLLAVVSLCVAAVLVSGCAKKSALGTGAGSGAGSGTSQTPGSSPEGVTGGLVGSAGAPGATGRPEAAGSGTTLPALPSPTEFVESSALRDINFEFDRHTVRAQDMPILDANARWLKSNARALLLIEGHADERGTNEYNLALGERRAKAARDHLVTRGIDTARITTITYGEERPLCTERAEGCWARNRRSHFLVKQ